MAVASVVPIIWGAATDHMAIADWITLTAEAICWVELRGSAGLRLRVLLGGTMLAVLFALLGCITGPSIWLSLAGMLFVGFISGLFKNLGDRGSGLAISVYLMFIICNAYPPQTLPDLEKRMLYVLIGGVWTTLVGMAASAFIPEQEPYRRSIAMIWKAISGLTGTIAKGWDGKGPRSGLREVYLKEKEVRAAIDNSLHFHETMAHQVSEKKQKEYRLAQTRKATSLVATHVIAMSEELESLNFSSLDNAVRLKLYALSKALQQTVDRMAVYVLTLKPEEELLLASRMARLKKLTGFLEEYPFAEKSPEEQSVKRILQLTERAIRLVESCIKNLQELGAEKPIYRSYSLIKTIYVLHPKYLLRNIRLLFNFNTLTARYSLRTAVAATIAMFVFKWWHIDHGYWLPFTVIIVIQPYFGATLKKALDRLIGTVLGGLVGGALLRLPSGLHVKEIILFICAVFMVYYLRKRYSVAAFFITVSLVMLFAVEESVSTTLLLTRLFCTIGGAALGIIAGFALLPTWDRKLLPRYLAASVVGNYEYFLATFFPDEPNINWTRYKRIAETHNSNVFDSFNRYIQEPSARKHLFDLFYQLITYNVRLTRELNNIHLEQENRNDRNALPPATTQQQACINECLGWFNRNLELIKQLDTGEKISLHTIPENRLSPFCLTGPQSIYVDKMIIDLKSMYQDLQMLSGAPATDEPNNRLSTVKTA
jgi:uncharacterized membrane protein YgaE (UPF0421/DUF939 family)